MNFPSPYNPTFPSPTPLYSPTPPPPQNAPPPQGPPFPSQPAPPLYQPPAANVPNNTSSFQTPANFTAMDCAVFPPTINPPKANNSFGAKPGAFFAVFNGNKQA